MADQVITKAQFYFDDINIGKTRVVEWYTKCFACGANYHPKYYRAGPNVGDVVCVNDHVCDPNRLARREEELRHEFDDDELYCECDDLDCKFEFLDSIMNEME